MKCNAWKKIPVLLIGSLMFIACGDGGSSTSAEDSSASGIPGSSGSVVIPGSSSSGIVYGVLADTRDSKSYKTVVIGTQTWMAENLNHPLHESFCYDNLESNCEKYGRLYRFWQAMGLTGNLSAADIPDPNGITQGICPAGWHIPNVAEWEQLRDFVQLNNGGVPAATSLMSKTGWSVSGGTDEFGFNGQPGGQATKGYNGFGFSYKGSWGMWWTPEVIPIPPTNVFGTKAYAFQLNEDSKTFQSSEYEQQDYLSVRCVQDN